MRLKTNTLLGFHRMHATSYYIEQILYFKFLNAQPNYNRDDFKKIIITPNYRRGAPMLNLRGWML